MGKQRNILVFLTDDHAQWALGTYGNATLHTPNLDYLARSGVQFDNAFTPTPVCSPARASFFTGRLASQHGIHDYLKSTDPEIQQHPWLQDEVTLASLLSAAGYETALCGKWHLGADEMPQPGFDHWFSLAGDYPIPHGDRSRFSDNGRICTLSGYKTQIITEQAVSFLKNRDRQRSFFLFVGLYATHSPWRGHPERLVSRYRGDAFDDIPRGETYPFGRQALESTTVDRRRAPEALAQYYAAVSEIDESVGRLLDVLEAQGTRDETLIIYTADHGLNCGHHGIWGKGNGTLPLNMVDESIRIPLLLNAPVDLPGGQRRTAFVDHLDLFQTLAAYAEIDLPSDRAQPYPGRSFWPYLANNLTFPNWRQRQFGEYGDLRMVRTQRYKLLCRLDTDVYELFDLQTDAREMVDLSTNPAQQARVAQLAAEISAYFETHADPRKDGRFVRQLPRHNDTEAWRTVDPNTD